MLMTGAFAEMMLNMQSAIYAAHQSKGGSARQPFILLAVFCISFCLDTHNSGTGGFCIEPQTTRCWVLADEFMPRAARRQGSARASVESNPRPPLRSASPLA